MVFKDLCVLVVWTIVASALEELKYLMFLFSPLGGSSIAQMTECYFPRPTQGQSLMSFLSSQDFHTCAELDKVQIQLAHN